MFINTGIFFSFVRLNSCFIFFLILFSFLIQSRSFSSENKDVDVSQNSLIETTGTIDPFLLYPSGINFDVYRKGSLIGTHKVEFQSEDELIKVTSIAVLKVKLLFVTIYKHYFKATELWDNGVLISFVSEENENGKQSNVNAGFEGNNFFSEGRKGLFTSDNWKFPSTHWDRDILRSSIILNAITGQLANVKVLDQGFEKIQTSSGVIDAQKFEYTGQVRNTFVWYDKDNRWVKMEFTTKKGDTITYVCKECGLENQL